LSSVEHHGDPESVSNGNEGVDVDNTSDSLSKPSEHGMDVKSGPTASKPVSMVSGIIDLRLADSFEIF